MRSLRVRAGLLDLDRGVVARSDGDTVRLTTRERELLAYLSARPSVDVSREELLTEVWGYAPTVQTRALDTAVKQLRRKIEVDRKQPDHLLTVWGHGYRFEPLIPGDLDDDGLVGRAEELEALREAVRRPGGLVVVTGPGGVGKSRLVRDALASDQPVFVPLHVDDGHGLDGVMERALPASDLPLAARLAQLDVPLILDDAEHLTRPLEAALQRWRAAAPQAVWVVTSRVALQLPDAQELRLGPLAREDVALLLERLWDGDTPDAAWLRELAARLDGLPLAAELVAPWSAVLSPDVLLARVEELLDRREGASMQGVVGRSVELLAPELRATLGWVSCFPEDLDASDVEALVDHPRALEHLVGLRRASLLGVDRDGRLRLLPLVRRAVRTLLPADPARRTRWAEHVLQRARQERSLRWTTALEQGYRDEGLPDALRGALGIELFHALPRTRGPSIDGRFGEQVYALTRQGNPDTRADGDFIRCAVALRGMLAPTDAWFDEATAHAALATPWRHVRALALQGSYARLHRRPEEALRHLEAATRLQADLPADHHGAIVYSELGLVYREEGRLDEALVALEYAQQLAEQGGTAWTRIIVFQRRGGTMQLTGHFASARMWLQQAKDLALAHGMPGMASLLDQSLATAHHEVGDLEAASAWLMVERPRAERFHRVEGQLRRALLHLERGALGPACTEAAAARAAADDGQGPLLGFVELVEGLCLLFADDPGHLRCLRRAAEDSNTHICAVAAVWLAALGEGPVPDVPAGDRGLAQLVATLVDGARGQGVFPRLLRAWLDRRAPAAS